MQIPFINWTDRNTNSSSDSSGWILLSLESWVCVLWKEYSQDSIPWLELSNSYIKSSVTYSLSLVEFRSYLSS